MIPPRERWKEHSITNILVNKINVLWRLAYGFEIQIYDRFVK